MKVDRMALQTINKFIPVPRIKKDLKFEKIQTPSNDVLDRVILCREDIVPEPVIKEEPSVNNRVSGEKKESTFRVDNGLLQGTTININQRGTLTILDESPLDTLKPQITGRLSTSLILNVPDTRQGTDYSCGASSLQAVLMYWGEEYSETELMEMLHTSPEQGTHPDDIVRVSKELGYEAELRENLTLEDLERSIQEGVPVIVDGQAWRDGEDLKKPWSEVWESGHYMVVVGFDGDKVCFEDPSLLGSKGVMTRQEFLDRWHDYEGDIPFDEKDKQYIHAGIFIRGKKPSPPPEFMHIDE